mmetsp:Transcript_23922/g.39909  ORF Transcript_23922/g.39909 Transcript_23922/m.39909 type:complete len:292 (+) Transcript_23922:125-1000(+)
MSAGTEIRRRHSASSHSIRIVCLSDTYGKERDIVNVPGGDILVHCGDFSSDGTVDQLIAFREFIDKQEHVQKFVVSGNKDTTIQTAFFKKQGKILHPDLFADSSFDPVTYSQQCLSTVSSASSHFYTYLDDKAGKISSDLANDVRIYGACWQPLGIIERGTLEEKWDKIPLRTDILITHSPPYGILDRAKDGKHCGDRHLLDAVQNRVKPKLHIFGHSQDNYGTYFDGTTLFVNASICNRHMKVTHPPIVVDLPYDKEKFAVVHPTSAEHIHDFAVQKRRKREYRARCIIC